jgi:hypothetical protein
VAKKGERCRICELYCEFAPILYASTGCDKKWGEAEHLRRVASHLSSSMKHWTEKVGALGAKYLVANIKRLKAEYEQKQARQVSQGMEDLPDVQG